jgi:hypothetical protein
MSTDRMLHLLTEQTERPLDRAEKDELDRLLAQHPGWKQDDFELAAAATHLAFLGRAQGQLPDALAKTILAQATVDVAETSAMPSFRDLPPPPPQPAKVVPLKRKPAVPPWLGWIAAAAAIIIAILAIVLSQPKAIDPSQLYAEMAQKPGVTRTSWTIASGEVVWDNEAQRGFMRFEGLAKNDPTVSQYQLWIFDAQRDEATPVDGGVFDAESGTIIVPIDAKIRVFEPVAFAVTVEKPGGVVVSKREKVVALAKVAG